MNRKRITMKSIGHFSPKAIMLAVICSCMLFCPMLSKTLAQDKEEGFLTPLRARGFSLIPSPQQVTLGDQNIIVDNSWTVVSKIGEEDVAVRRLHEGAKELHHLELNSTGENQIVLDVKPGVVKETDDPAINEQGYVLSMTPRQINITGNSKTGLFYGVQSLLQMLRRNPSGQLILPAGEIRDWPTLQLRFVHWDTKHNQKRMETLKRLIDWHAYFKVNMIAFEMEDKYEYPRHPVIGAPGAYTKAEMQELTRYASERHIQLVPDIQAPAHMAYVLKHKEFEHLKSDGSNYQACMCDPESIELIYDIYQDMIDATPGVDYFLVSTDEVYYAGICDKCKKPYNDENRSLAWVEFAKNAHDWLAERGRRMIAWVEYPILPQHLSLLPPDIINGIGGSEKLIKEEKKIGMRGLVYSSTQGAELLFPNHFASQSAGVYTEGRIAENAHSVRDALAAGTNPIGTFAAAWDDAGLHEETFHLGWASVTQYGWAPVNGPTVEQTVADFMDVFYGQGSTADMVPIYKSLIRGARFFERGWDEVTSKERGPGYGNSFGPGIGTRRTDEILSLPEIPASGTLALATSSSFSEQYKALIEEAEGLKLESDDLLQQLAGNMSRIERNRYNLEVFLSIAYLERYFIKTVLTLHKADERLMKASQAASENKPSDAVAHMVEARKLVDGLVVWGDGIWQGLVTTWEKSRFEKGRSVDGSDFVHVLDDVKDHFADRRKGLDYMIAPFQRMDLPKWSQDLQERIVNYAKENKVMLKGQDEVRLED